MAKKTTVTPEKPSRRRYVAYYRVSTQKQGKSGLGLEAQQAAVLGFAKDAEIVAEYTEIESGKKNQRAQLLATIDHAKQKGATLLIAKLDRLSRNASFIFALRDSGVQFQCVDLPDANTLTVGIFATMAQHEREVISSRTKAALDARLERVGEWRKSGRAFQDPDVLQRAKEANRQRGATNPNNRRAISLITLLHQSGRNLVQIAAYLNEAGFTTAMGKRFQAVQVRRLLDRAGLRTKSRE